MKRSAQSSLSDAMKRFLVTTLLATLGAMVGFVAPFVCLLVLAVLVSWWHEDPAAGGVLGFFMIALGPIGIAIGIVTGVVLANRISDNTPKSHQNAGICPQRRRFLARLTGRDQCDD
jgi:hypothetical protein